MGGGYLVFILVPISQKLIKLMSSIFLLGLTSTPSICFSTYYYFGYVFHMSLCVCVCECLIIHTQPCIIYWVYLFWVHYQLLVQCSMLFVISLGNASNQI